MTALMTGEAAAAFGAGALTSLSPCVAPRLVAITALAQRARRPLPITVAFTAGLVLAYACIGGTAGAAGALSGLSPAIYLLMAAALVGGGIAMLARGSTEDRCTPACTPVRRTSIGGAFVLGASSALVASPCCLPLAATIASSATLSGSPLEGAVLLIAFALGHAVPVLCAAAAGPGIALAIRRSGAGEAGRIVAGGLMLSLGLFYGAQA